MIELIGSLLVVASKVLDKTPDYPERVRKTLYELQGEYNSMRTISRSDPRFNADKLLKLKENVETYMTTLAKEIVAKNEKSN